MAVSLTDDSDSVAPAPDIRLPPQRGTLSQPRATPWVQVPPNDEALKGRPSSFN